jgi:hypothetical protein
VKATTETLCKIPTSRKPLYRYPSYPEMLHKPQNPQTVFTLLFYRFSPSVAREKEIRKTRGG